MQQTDQFIKLVRMKEIERVGAFEAKTNLSALLEKVAGGRVFHITKRGRLVAELRPIRDADARMVFGEDKGAIKIGVDFDEPLADMGGYMP